MDGAVFASLPASDIDRARAWYKDKLGLDPGDSDAQGTLFYLLGDTGFMVYESAFAGTNQATAAGLSVADFDAAVAELRGAGVAFEDVDMGDGMATVDGVLTAPDGNRVAWFKDSEGNIWGLSQDMG
ncbi:MAG: VOC family protein [Acidimicrobiia bacterium]|nr:VOC family protein [Acidimicrobiia bacterium]